MKVIKVNKAVLTYVGINRDKAISKNKQFSVEITGDELKRIKTFPFPTTFTGKVVAAGGPNCGWEIGTIGHNFCSPFYDFHHYHHAGWIIKTCVCEGSFHHESCPLRVN